MNIAPVSAEDVELAVDLAVYRLRKAELDAWDYRAGTLKWTCWETVEHIADDLFAYAVQMGPRHPPINGHVPFVCEPRRSGGPASTVFAEREAGPEGLLQVLEASAALLAAMVRTMPPEVRAHHVMGLSDPEGFAAMGVVEILVHTHDLAEGLGLEWDPPAELCARVLARLFPDAPTDTEPWPTLLWATGRGTLPGRARLTRWRWHAAPADER
ncbi:maleylpyruvate isomerase N-terminal domain-containing protein [Glycomyces arizonensis]|uniref:maleylpyruvate isomerase N-terminal domain-containing protein n=1 Tax=Glycomyces arizonensis TaxID=256035 RepID=UPI00042702D7|nr:maleylpyruvate isomerase N-terminal domain-containing protein [Glycomyces arizonensis]